MKSEVIWDEKTENAKLYIRRNSYDSLRWHCGYVEIENFEFNEDNPFFKFIPVHGNITFIEREGNNVTFGFDVAHIYESTQMDGIVGMFNRMVNIMFGKASEYEISKAEEMITRQSKAINNYPLNKNMELMKIEVGKLHDCLRLFCDRYDGFIKTNNKVDYIADVLDECSRKYEANLEINVGVVLTTLAMGIDIDIFARRLGIK